MPRFALCLETYTEMCKTGLSYVASNVNGKTEDKKGRRITHSERCKLESELRFKRPKLGAPYRPTQRCVKEGYPMLYVFSPEKLKTREAKEAFIQN
jgi:hypothetical protein